MWLLGLRPFIGNQVPTLQMSPFCVARLVSSSLSVVAVRRWMGNGRERVRGREGGRKRMRERNGEREREGERKGERDRE